MTKVLDLGSDCADVVPILGKILKWGATAAKKVDRARQVNAADNIVALVAPKDAEKVFESVSRKLTEFYFAQYEKKNLIV